MKKFITFSILFSILFSITGYSQKAKRPNKEASNKQAVVRLQTQFAKHILVKEKRALKQKPLAPGDCLAILPGFEIDSSIVLFTDADGDDTEDGYVVGTNPYDDQQKASFYDFSGATGSNYLNAVGIFFFDAQGDDLTKIVPIRVYDGTTGVPGAEIGHTNLTLQTISDSLLSDDYYGVPVTFTNLQLPASKKVFISVDMSNLDYYEGDLLGVYSSDWDELPVNTAWEQWDGGAWYSFTDATVGWGSTVSISMVPVIGESVICTNIIVPVKMVSFNGASYGTGNKLEWTVASEINNKGYELERSSDGVSYITVGYMATQAQGGNSSNSLKYSFIDNAPAAQKSFYRLKQIDINGITTYSKIVVVNRGIILNSGLVQAFPNPVRNNLNVVVDMPVNKTGTLIVSDVTGKVLIQKNVQSNGANKQVNFNTSALSKGTYFIRLVGEGNKKLLKFVKE